MSLDEDAASQAHTLLYKLNGTETINNVSSTPFSISNTLVVWLSQFVPCRHLNSSRRRGCVSQRTEKKSEETLARRQMSSKIKTAWHSSRTSRTSRTAKDELSVVLDFSQNLDVPNDLKEKPGPGPTCNYYYSSHGHGKNCSDILASSINGKSGKDTWVGVD